MYNFDFFIRKLFANSVRVSCCKKFNFLLCLVQKNNRKTTRYKMAKRHEPRNAVFIKKGWFLFWCIVCPPIAFLYVVCADSVEI